MQNIYYSKYVLGGLLFKIYTFFIFRAIKQIETFKNSRFICQLFPAYLFIELF